MPSILFGGPVRGVGHKHDSLISAEKLQTIIHELLRKADALK